MLHSANLFIYFLQVCLGAALGISRPSSLLWFKSDLFTYGLGFLMLSMGLTLTVDDFKQVTIILPTRVISFVFMPQEQRRKNYKS